MTFAALLLLAALSEPAAANGSAAVQAQPKEEKKICRRINATESRLASKRVCKTVQQWRDEQDSEGLDGGLRGRARSN